MDYCKFWHRDPYNAENVFIRDIKMYIAKYIRIDADISMYRLYSFNSKVYKHRLQYIY